MTLQNIGLIRQWLASTTAAVCMAVAASTFGWLTPIAVEFINNKDSPIPMTEFERSWVTGCASISSTLSCIPVGIMADRWGRKFVLLLSGPVALAGWILLITTRSLYVVYLAGIIHGYAMSTAFCMSSIYIAEIASPNIRGALCGQFMTLFYLGTLYVDLTAYYTTYSTYLYLLALLPLVNTISLWFMPETPYHLIKTGRDVEAMKVLRWLSPTTDSMVIGERLLDIKQSIRPNFTWRDFAKVSQHRRALLILATAYFLKCFGGQISLLVYITQLFSSIFTDVNGILLTIVLTLVLCFVCFISGFISDTLGRRPIMYTTSFLSGIFHVIIAFYFFYYRDSGISSISTLHMWIIFVSMTLALALGNASMSIFLPTVGAEYFTTDARPLGSGFAHMFGGLSSFLSIMTYQFIKQYIGDYFNFLIFGACSFMAAFLIYFLIQETAKMALERINTKL